MTHKIKLENLQSWILSIKVRFISFYKDNNGTYFGRRTNAMVLWFGVFAFSCLGLKIYQMWCAY